MGTAKAVSRIADFLLSSHSMSEYVWRGNSPPFGGPGPYDQPGFAYVHFIIGSLYLYPHSPQGLCYNLREAQSGTQFRFTVSLFPSFLCISAFLHPGRNAHQNQSDPNTFLSYPSRVERPPFLPANRSFRLNF